MPTTHIVVEAAHALKHSKHPALRGLQVESSGTALIVSGRVTSYYLKQLAAHRFPYQVGMVSA